MQKAEEAVTAAQQQAAASAQKDQQALAVARGQVSAARTSLAVTRATQSGAALKDRQTVAGGRLQVHADEVLLDAAVRSGQASVAEAERSAQVAEQSARHAPGATIAAAERTARAAIDAALATARANAAPARQAEPGTVAQDEAQVIQDQNTLAAARQMLAETRLTAPFAGTVDQVSGTVGQSAGGGGGGGGGGGSGSQSSVVTLVSHQLAVTADVSETQVTRLALGDTATALVNADTPAQVPARVATIAPTPAGGGAFPVTFDLAATPAGARPGLTVSLSVVLARSDDVLSVPSAAVHGSGAHAFVTTLGANGTRRSVRVTVGLVGDRTTAIAAGLRAGQRVVVGG